MSDYSYLLVTKELRLILACLTSAFLLIEDRKQNTEYRIKDDPRLRGQIPGGKLLVAGNNIRIKM
jgi:hypothetical protein